MEVQIILGQILRQAKEYAESLLMEEKKSSELKVEKQKELAYQKSKVSSIVNRGEYEAETIRKSIISDAKRTANWMMLSEKERLVVSVLNELQVQLKAFAKSADYLLLLQSLISDASLTLGGGKLEIILCKQDVTLPLEIILLSEKIEAKTGKKTELTVSGENLTSCGGCILRTSDNKIVIDNTFPAILQRHDNDLKVRIAQILFEK